jgi:hypothetical protein
MGYIVNYLSRKKLKLFLDKYNINSYELNKVDKLMKTPL